MSAAVETGVSSAAGFVAFRRPAPRVVLGAGFSAASTAAEAQRDAALFRAVTFSAFGFSVDFGEDAVADFVFAAVAGLRAVLVAFTLGVSTVSSDTVAADFLVAFFVAEAIFGVFVATSDDLAVTFPRFAGAFAVAAGFAFAGVDAALAATLRPLARGAAISAASLSGASPERTTVSAALAVFRTRGVATVLRVFFTDVSVVLAFKSLSKLSAALGARRSGHAARAPDRVIKAWGT
ncbi:hypothetical protein AA23498_0955 [Acetobacter nitrogenifigens DSM 23921 = NBRC 105050]|nr:hypothetical protein AA23498_0955 [Acetobacter nitrogenifigens DSM 23921 = NBRC 105050]